MIWFLIAAVVGIGTSVGFWALVACIGVGAVDRAVRRGRGRW